MLRSLQLSLVCLLCSVGVALADVPFELDGVDPFQFRQTTFATGLNYPVGMVELEDGSILVGTSNGSSFFGSQTGSLIRLVDEDGDGVADSQSPLFTSVPGGSLSAVRKQGDLVFTTGQNRPISVFRTGATPADTMSLLGTFSLSYSGGWLHPHSALATRPSPTSDNAVDLLFQVGSKTNFDKTTATVQLNSDFGVSGALNGDSVYMVTLSDDGDSVSASNLTQIATGLRNAAGFAFNEDSGDLYIQDNGIDGVVNANEPTSADELNVIRAADIGGDIEDFGFPSTYVAYRTEDIIGDQGIQPLVAFLPLPPPDGQEAEGPNDIALSPPQFPSSLANGVFLGMHGKFSLGGRSNEENPLVFASLDDGSYIHLIDNGEPDVGHLDGLLSTNDSLFIADISPRGSFGTQDSNRGVIYQIRSRLPFDFDGDSTFETEDIDVLGNAIRDQTTQLDFDLDDSGSVDQSDFEYLLENVVEFEVGDIDFDGDIDVADSTILVANWTGAMVAGDASYSLGDVDLDGDVDVADRTRMVVSWTGALNPQAIVVAEPQTTLPIAMVLFFLLLAGRSIRS